MRHGLFSILISVSLLVFGASLRAVLNFSLWGDNQYDKYSYTLAIPFISVALVILERRRIFATVEYSLGTGLGLLLVATALNVLLGWSRPRFGDDLVLSARMAALVGFWLGGVILCYGWRAFRAGAFAFLFLLASVPLPDVLLETPITVVRYGSTAVCSGILTLAGVPVLRDGFVFTLSKVSIEVAKECSGIHSTLAICVISLIAGHLFLISLGKKLTLVLLALPVVCVTNGLRIAGLTLLAQYVNPGILQSSLHHRGGLGFFALALVLLFGVLFLLQRLPGPERLHPPRANGERLFSPPSSKADRGGSR
jgi:exosortase